MLQFKITHKLTFAFFLIGLFAITSVGIEFYYQFSNSLIYRTQEQLRSINNLKKKQIEDYLKTQLKQAETLGNYLQKVNPDSLCLKIEANERKNFECLLCLDADQTLIAQKGNCTWDVPKILSLFSNMKTSIDLLDISAVVQSPKIVLAYWIPLKVSDSTNRYLIAIEVPEKIQNILFERRGMGNSGESYIVGSDYRMRTVSRFYPQKNPLHMEVKSQGVLEAFRKGQGSGIFKDYRGVEVLSAYSRIRLRGINWVMLSEIDYEEALKPLKNAHSNLSLIILVNIIIILTTSYIISIIIINPILFLEKIISQLSLGNLQKITPTKRQDEIGSMTQAVAQLIHNLEKVTDFAREIGQGNFSSDFRTLSEYDTLGKSLLEMRSQLRKLHQQTSELTQKTKLALITGQEKERIRLSKDIHDGVGPLLTSIKLQVSALEVNSLEKEHIKKLIDETISETRRISNNLMPSVLLDFGLGAAIHNLVKNLDNSGLKITFMNELKEKESLLNYEINIALFRIAQEAVNNALKHAHATEIKLSLTEFEDKVVFYCKDNGRGFDMQELRKSELTTQGLLNMEERTKLLEGEFFIHSDQDGTSIEVEIPLYETRREDSSEE